MKKKHIIEHLIDTITTLTIILTFLFALVGICFNIVYQKNGVVGYSMYPTINSTVPNEKIEGDVAFVNIYAPIKVNDIAVARVTWFSKGPIIKRVVATPGDVLKINDNGDNYSLVVNGKTLYTRPKTDISTHGHIGGTNSYYIQYLKFLRNPDFANNVVEIDGEKCIVMNKNEYFFMSDNWCAESIDCMQNGVIHGQNIEGRVDFVVPYGNSQSWTMVFEMVKLVFIPNWI